MHARIEDAPAGCPLVDGAWAELAKPQADQAQVMQLLDEAADPRRAFLREATAQTLACWGP